MKRISDPQMLYLMYVSLLGVIISQGKLYPFYIATMMEWQRQNDDYSQHLKLILCLLSTLSFISFCCCNCGFRGAPLGLLWVVICAQSQPTNKHVVFSQSDLRWGMYVNVWLSDLIIGFQANTFRGLLHRFLLLMQSGNQKMALLGVQIFSPPLLRLSWLTTTNNTTTQTCVTTIHHVTTTPQCSFHGD